MLSSVPASNPPRASIFDPKSASQLNDWNTIAFRFALGVLRSEPNYFHRKQGASHSIAASCALVDWY
jgi:hypothetical protein